MSRPVSFGPPRAVFLYASTIMLMLAGCTGPADTGSGDDGGAPAAGPDPSLWSRPNDGRDCSEAILLAPVSFEHADQRLPEGFKAIDLGAAFGAPVPAGQAAAVVFVYTCAEHAWGDGAHHVAGVAIAVEDPHIEGATPAADHHYYILESYTDDTGLAAYLSAIGWAVQEGPVAYTTDAVALAQTATGTVGGGADQGGFTLGVDTLAESTLTGISRSWHVTPHGVAYLDYKLDTAVTAGGATCAFGPGSVAADATGRSDCTGEDVVGLLFASDWESRFTVLADTAGAD